MAFAKYFVFSLCLLEWTIADVKEWSFETLGSEAITQNFEREEVDGRVLLSSTVRTNESMETLGLTTIGKKEKFLDETKKLVGMITLILNYYLSCMYGGTKIFQRMY